MALSSNKKLHRNTKPSKTAQLRGTDYAMNNIVLCLVWLMTWLLPQYVLLLADSDHLAVLYLALRAGAVKCPMFREIISGRQSCAHFANSLKVRCVCTYVHTSMYVCLWFSCCNTGKRHVVVHVSAVGVFVLHLSWLALIMFSIKSPH